MSSQLSAKKRILLVDDDEDFRGIVEVILNKIGFEVTTSKNGKSAAQIVTLDEFDLVISDIRMPEMNGIQLTHFIKNQKKTLPIILITGFSEIKETAEAYEMGADGFLAKPFNKDDLLECIKNCLPDAFTDAPPPQKVSLDTEYCKLSIDEFVSGKQIRYGIFVRLSEFNYVKIAHEGEDLTLDRIKSYKEKGIHYLYLRRDDFKRYISFNTNLAPLVLSSSKIPQEKKIAFFKHANEIVFEQLTFPDVAPELYKESSTLVGNMLTLVTEQDDLFNLISSVGVKGDPLFTHSMAVSLYSVLIAKECGWASPGTLIKVGMAGLLHDVGLKRLDPKLVYKNPGEMTPEEIRLIETHTVQGLDILGSIPSIPEDVARVAYQHHEDCKGLGYPQGLTRTHIDPLARLVHVADAFCLMAWSRDGGSRLGAKDTANRMISLYAETLDSDFFSALLRIVGILEPGQTLKRSRI